MQSFEFSDIIFFQFLAMLVTVDCHVLRPMVFEKSLYIAHLRYCKKINEEYCYPENSIYKIEQDWLFFLVKPYEVCEQVRERYEEQDYKTERDDHCPHYLILA